MCDENHNLLLTIGITSYNQPEELRRSIMSVKSAFVDDVEIVVSDDNSPQKNRIEKVVNECASSSTIKIRFCPNNTNLGYDMNIASILQKAKGEYVFFLSDDDIIAEGFIDYLITFLKEKRHLAGGVLYAPFVYIDSDRIERKLLKADSTIRLGEKNCKKHIYASILFSGLIFCKSCVADIDCSRFKNLIYIQVYMFLHALNNYGGYYFEKPSIMFVNDGVNGFGLSESSGSDFIEMDNHNKLLSDRSTAISNLEYHKTLFKVIRMFDEDEGTHVMDSFEHQYSLHSITGLTNARLEGRQSFQEYCKELYRLDVNLYPVVRCYIILLSLFGVRMTTFLLSGFRRLVKKEH